MTATRRSVGRQIFVRLTTNRHNCSRDRSCDVQHVPPPVHGVNANAQSGPESQTVHKIARNIEGWIYDDCRLAGFKGYF